VLAACSGTVARELPPAGFARAHRGERRRRAANALAQGRAGRPRIAGELRLSDARVRLHSVEAGTLQGVQQQLVHAGSRPTAPVAGERPSTGHTGGASSARSWRRGRSGGHDSVAPAPLAGCLDSVGSHPGATLAPPSAMMHEAVLAYARSVGSRTLRRRGLPAPPAGSLARYGCPATVLGPRPSVVRAQR
jgi:hypothetical protein